jgi:squalene cyclase
VRSEATAPFFLTDVRVQEQQARKSAARAARSLEALQHEDGYWVGDLTAAVADGVRWLCEKPQADGGWEENITTGTGFPGVFYIRYDMYRRYFPLLALSIYARA